MPRRPRLRSADRQSVAPGATETANETPEMNPLCGLTRQFCEGPAMAYPLLNPHMAYCARCAGALNRKGGRPVMKTAIGLVAAMTITATVAATGFSVSSGRSHLSAVGRHRGPSGGEAEAGRRVQPGEN